jgi:hypothetical protein
VEVGDPPFGDDVVDVPTAGHDAGALDYFLAQN